MELKNFRLKIRYKVGKKKFCATQDDNYIKIDSSVTKNRLRLSLTPTEKIELISVALTYDYNFSDDEKFFSNGYQSWTTSREYTKTDHQKGLLFPCNVIPVAKKFADPSGDYSFTRYSKKGYFHSFTYAYLRESEKVTLLGSLSERQGYTIFYADMNKNLFMIEKDVEALTIDKKYQLFDVMLFEGGYDEVFDAYFAAMKIAPPKVEHLAGYTSWYNYFQSINQDIILRDLEGITRKEIKGVNIFQIDDGSASQVGDWLDLDKKKFPDGLKTIVEKIHKKGLLAGLWLAPFSAEYKARLVSEHPDWFVKNKKGKMITGGFAWNGFYVLDLYNKDVRNYLKNVFDTVFNEWGFDMVKLDFLYSVCYKPLPNKTRGTIMCEAMDFLRECCSDKLILGCGVPLGPSFGVVDACRISCDVELSFKDKFYTKVTNQEVISTKNAMNNSIFRRHLNKRAFINDPDVFFLRDDGMRKAKFSWKQKLLLAKINHTFGSVLFVSDNAGSYDAAKIDALNQSLKPFGGKVGDCSYIDERTIGINYSLDGKNYYLEYDAKTGENTLSEV